jgi:hypothetical protein
MHLSQGKQGWEPLRDTKLWLKEAAGILAVAFWSKCNPIAWDWPAKWQGWVVSGSFWD